MASQSSRNFILQKNSPSSIEGRVLNFADRLIESLDKKNQEDPGWLERSREAKRQAVYSGKQDVSNTIVARAVQSMQCLMDTLTPV